MLRERSRDRVRQLAGGTRRTVARYSAARSQKRADDLGVAGRRAGARPAVGARHLGTAAPAPSAARMRPRTSARALTPPRAPLAHHSRNERSGTSGSSRIVVQPGSRAAAAARGRACASRCARS